MLGSLRLHLNRLGAKQRAARDSGDAARAG